MALNAKASNYDYTIHDANGVVGVKDDVKYPISKEDWDRENPHIEHKDSVCTECTYVPDQTTLFTYFVTREDKENATVKPKLCGKFTMPGWVGHSHFYVFRCRECRVVGVDYVHGYTNYGLYYLRCTHCKTPLPLDPQKERSMYEAEGGPVPPASRGERKRELNNVVKEATKGKDVKVFSSGLGLVEGGKFTRFRNFLREYFNY